MHGGAQGSGAPTGNQNAVKHGLYTKAAIEERKELRTLMRDTQKPRMASRDAGANASLTKSGAGAYPDGLLLCLLSGRRRHAGMLSFETTTSKMTRAGHEPKVGWAAVATAEDAD